MSKKIKLNGLYILELATVTGYYRDKKYLDIEFPVVLAYAKYSFFNRAKIKYFVNALDKTKCFPSEREKNGLCAVSYYPLAPYNCCDIDWAKGYITCAEANNFLKGYNDLIKSKKHSTEKSYENDNKIEQNESSMRNNWSQLTYGKILTDSIFASEPAIGRKNEVENLIISLAQEKKSPILVGKSGVGKTSIVDELAYLIQKDNVPKFLKGKKILEVDAGELVAGTKYRGDLETKMLSVINYVHYNNAILFIDEIHRIYGAGKVEDGNIDIASMLKTAIDRYGIKVIGTTTIEEYNVYFSSDALKRRFNSIVIDEPNDRLLYEIICHVFDNYSKKNGISIDKLDRNIIDILIAHTKSKHRKYDDIICNPDLVLGIIDYAFAIAKVSDSAYLTNEHVICAIKKNERIYDSAKEKAVEGILNLEQKEERKGRILKLY